MKLFRKMLLVILFLGMMMPLYSATENPKPEEKNPLSEFECPECGKKVNMAKEIKKLEKKVKKAQKKSKKKKKKDKAKDSEKGKDKKADEQQPFLPKKMKCPKCKKVVPITQPEDKKAEAEKTEAEKTEAETGDNK